MKLFPVRTQALRLPALVLVCLLLVLGAVLGFAVCRAVPQQDRQELSDYLHQYAQATAAFGPRCLFVLPCTLLLTVQGLSAAARRRDGRKVRLTEGAYWRRVGLCGLILLIGAALELTFGPRLLQWVIARTL